MIGGFRTNGKTSATAYRYDPVRNVWSRISEYPISMGFGGCGGTADGIVCAGGLTLAGVQPGNPEVTTDRSYGYDAATDTWTRNADMPYAVSGATYSNANGELQVATGFTDAGFDYGNTEHVIQYDPTAEVWTEPLPDAPRTSVFAGYGTACFPFQVGGTRYAGPNPGMPLSAVLPGLGGCTGEDVNWLSQNRTTLELAPGQSKQITVTADAGVLTAPGAYAADLHMITDTPYVPQPVRVGLKATAPDSWAEVAGTVTDTATGKSLAGATVSVSQRGEHPVTVTTDRHGAYHVWFKAGKRTDTVDDQGYARRSQAVSARPGRTTTLDFALSAD